MTMRGPTARRGQPVVALVLIMGAWVGMRSVVWAQTGDETPPAAQAGKPADKAQASLQVQAGSSPAAAPLGFAHVPKPAPVAAPTVASPVEAGSRLRRFAPVAAPVWEPAPPRAGAPEPQAVAPPSVTASRPSSSSARIAAGHQLLYLAALSQLPMPALGAPAEPPSLPVRGRVDRRWSADAWLLLRRGGNGFNLPGSGLPGANLPVGAYGASQAGAVIRYRLAPSSPQRPSLYLRASTALHAPRGEEIAAGFSARPLARVPVAAMAEVRATRTLTGTIVRPAAALVSEFLPVDLPLGLRGEAYVQAGYVGGRGATPFIDGQGRLERRLISAGRWQLRAGAGTWGGAQKGAKRLDFGPTATLDVPLGPVGGRIAADWRFRVAGNAAPTSGPAITLSAGF